MTEEGRDVFSQGVEVSDDDPFAGSDFGDFGESDAEPASDVPNDLPVVNREGERVDAETVAETEAATPDSAPEVERPAAVPRGGAVAPPEDAMADWAPAPDTTPAEPPSLSAPAPASEAIEAEGGTGLPPEAQNGSQGVTAETEAPPDDDRDETEDYDDELEDDVDGEPEPEDEPEGQAEPPDAAVPKDVAGHRRYVVLRVDGPGKFSQVSWHENSKGKMVASNAPGAKRQTVVLSRTATDALRAGFVAVGSPENGVTLIAVAAVYFQPRRLKLKPPEPSRVRLDIS